MEAKLFLMFYCQVTMPFNLFELPTDAVDNSVGIRFERTHTGGFYCSFVTLNNFEPTIIFILFSIS